MIFSMDKPKTTPKDFFLWAGAMLALYVGVFNFIALLWNYVNYAFPDPLAYSSFYVDPYQSGISWEMASLIVLVPLFLMLMYFIHRDIKRDPTRREVWVRRWALYLTLFVAGVTVAVDLIYVLYAFLNGSDITAHFLLKALIVLLVAAAGFMHFIADLWGYWEQFPERNRRVAWGVGILVALSILAGFLIVGTPSQARAYRFDAQRVSDLQQIQSDILSYWQRTGKMPQNLSALNDPLSNTTVPQDPQTAAPYTYGLMGATSFQLCAVFGSDSRGIPAQASYAVPSPAGGGYSPTDDNWQHGAGKECFLRTIDPALYPPVKK